MNITFILVRHGKTQGNLEHKYIGSTDEPLCESGIKDLQNVFNDGIYPDCKNVYLSPMKRCKESAQIIFPNAHTYVYDGLKECSFGVFEGKNYEMLKDIPAYRQFIDSNGEGEIPDGESGIRFRKRCSDTFSCVVRDAQHRGLTTAGVVCHGGTIMSVLSLFDKKHGSFYNYQVENGSGYIGVFNTNKNIFISLKRL